MNYCPQCGYQNSNGNFCVKCGTALNSSVENQGSEQNTQQNQFTQTQQNFQQQSNGANGYNRPIRQQSPFYKIIPGRTLSANQVINDLKQSVNSYLYFIFSVIFSLNLLISFINIFSKDNGLLSKLDDMFGGYISVIDDIGDIFSFFSNMKIVFGIIALIPSGVICFGLWHFYISCIDEKNNSVNLTGVRAIQILYKIIYFLNMAALIIIEVVLLILAISAFDSSSDTAVAVIIGMILVPVFFIFNIIYAKKIIGIINSVCFIASSGVYNNSCRIPIFVVVWTCITALVSAFSASHWFIILLTVVQAVLISIILVSFNSKMVSKYLTSYDFSNTQQYPNNTQNSNSSK